MRRGRRGVEGDRRREGGGGGGGVSKSEMEGGGGRGVNHCKRPHTITHGGGRTAPGSLEDYC